MSNQYYARLNLVIKPLFNSWIAKDHLIPPASAAMYVKNLHTELMRSYLLAPEYHRNAANSPELIGGPWIGCEPRRAKEIEDLLEQTMARAAKLLKLANSIEQLDRLLMNEAKGSSLEPLYLKVPDTLKGYVELVYDLNNNPSIRFIEGLLYKSDFYIPSLQSFALSLIERDYRPFQWTTPWLSDNSSIHLQIPFNHHGLDELCRMRTTPQSFKYIKDVLQLEERDEQLFFSFLTGQEPPPYQRYQEEGVRLRYFGHACLLLETRAVSILTDPIVSYKFSADIDRFTFADLPDEIDYVVITHGHFDHLYFETLLQLRHKIKQLIIRKNAGGALQDPSLKLILRQLGFQRIVELEEFDTLDYERGSITALPFLGEHGDLSITGRAAHLIRIEGNSILCAADSCNIEPALYSHIHKLIGDIDILYLGMESAGAPLSCVYGPLFTRPLERKHDQSRRTTGSDFERAMAIVENLNVKQVYIYAMGLEPWLRHILPMEEQRDSKGIVDSNRLIEECLRRGILAARPYCKQEIILKPK
jgi:L-ascorbate metabolism protein UlaG (beta-lactamase superfamily)